MVCQPTATGQCALLKMDKSVLEALSYCVTTAKRSTTTILVGQPHGFHHKSYRFRV